MEDRLPRKLAAILYADVASYSRLTGEDEDATHRTLREYLDIISSTVESHGGQVTHYAGDAVLAKFEAVVDAVASATDVQKKLDDRNHNLPDDRKVEFRIGVNLGDVIEDRGDIYGDGVNVAARLEALAEPGGLCISDAVRTAVGKKLGLQYEDMGERAVKNISEPVRAYRVVLERRSARDTPPTLPDKPSIAVLPFDNLSGDPEQEYFSDGITEDIVTNLSRIRWLFVIARNSSFVFKGKAVDVREVSRELGVRYILEGSVRKAANKVRITVQLIDATTSAHLWAERYDRELADIFAVQDEITQNVAASIEPQLLEAEGRRARSRGENNLDAWDLVIRALYRFWRMTEQESAAAISMLEEAAKKHQEYGPAHSMLAFALLFSGHMGWRELSGLRSTAQHYAQTAISIDDQDGWAHTALGYLHFVGRRVDDAVAEFTKAIELNPNFAAAYGYRALANAHAGRCEEAKSDVDWALRLSPKDPQYALFIAVAGLADYLAGRNNDAVKHLAESVRLRPEFPGGKRTYCAALVQAGKLSEAKLVMEEIRKLQPDVSASLLKEMLPYSSPDTLARFIDDLRKAGLPE